MRTRNTSSAPADQTLVSQAIDVLAQEGPLSLARHVANYSRWTVEVRLAAAMLRARARGAETVGEIVDLIEGFRVGRVAITAWQARSELESLLKLVKAESPRTVLEIGTALGGTLFGFAQVAARDALLVTVDLPAGRFGGGLSPRPRALVPVVCTQRADDSAGGWRLP